MTRNPHCCAVDLRKECAVFDAVSRIAYIYVGARAACHCGPPMVHHVPASPMSRLRTRRNALTPQSVDDPETATAAVPAAYDEHRRYTCSGVFTRALATVVLFSRMCLNFNLKRANRTRCRCRAFRSRKTAHRLRGSPLTCLTTRAACLPLNAAATSSDRASGWLAVGPY